MASTLQCCAGYCIWLVVGPMKVRVLSSCLRTRTHHPQPPWMLWKSLWPEHLYPRRCHWIPFSTKPLAWQGSRAALRTLLLLEVLEHRLGHHPLPMAYFMPRVGTQRGLDFIFEGTESLAVDRWSWETIKRQKTNTNKSQGVVKVAMGLENVESIVSRGSLWTGSERMKSFPGTTNEKAGACSRKNSRWVSKENTFLTSLLSMLSDLCNSQIPFPHTETYSKTPTSCVCCI